MPSHEHVSPEFAAAMKSVGSTVEGTSAGLIVGMSVSQLAV